MGKEHITGGGQGGEGSRLVAQMGRGRENHGQVDWRREQAWAREKEKGDPARDDHTRRNGKKAVRSRYGECGDQRRWEGDRQGRDDVHETEQQGQGKQRRGEKEE